MQRPNRLTNKGPTSSRSQPSTTRAPPTGLIPNTACGFADVENRFFT